MRGVRVLERSLGVERTVIEDQALVVHARVSARERYRCAHCGRRCSRCDRRRRRWRTLNSGRTPVYLETAVQRVKCPQHGVVIGRVPWPWQDCGCTRAFEH